MKEPGSAAGLRFRFSSRRSSRRGRSDTVLSWSVAIALAVVVAAPAHAQPPRRSALAAALDRIVEDPSLASAFWGIEVRSLESGRTLYERHADKGFRPASTLKLVTTAAALDAFGPEARVRTTVETAARLDGRGRVLGDVFLVGRGDPGLSGRFGGGSPTTPFEALAEVLADAGVRRIEGRLVGHEGAFGGERRGPAWMLEDLAWAYGAEVSALTFNDNAVRVTLTPGERPGDPAAFEVEPRTSFVTVESRVVTGDRGAEEGVVLDRPLGSNRILLSGTLARGQSWEEDVAVENPALFAAAVFSEVLQARGIRVTGGVATSSESLPPAARVLAAHEGVSLARRIEEVNKESQNLHAELLLRQLGLQVGGEGTTETGLAAVEGFLDRRGVPRRGWRLVDGSGLSHTNVLTPRGLVALLVAMDRHPQREVFRASLAEAGLSGQLEDRMRGTPAAGRLIGKTGALRGVSGLAGYVVTASGEERAFAVLVGNHVGPSSIAKRTLDAFACALASTR
jgi:D-alanyl-D-alanine carboxypeptidase/D-alanyl-D-alanine-endopeptidase (penicillin-binding protein 4)